MDTTSDVSHAQNSFRNHAIPMIGLLVIQFALGMVTNLFVQFPDTNKPDQLWGFARSQIPFVSSQVDAYSLIMALAFIVAFLAFGWGLYAAKG